MLIFVTKYKSKFIVFLMDDYYDLKTILPLRKKYKNNK